VNIAWRK